MENKTLTIFLISLVLLFTIFNTVVLLNSNNDEVVVQPIVINQTSQTIEFPDFMLSEAEFEDLAIENESLRLAMESFNSKDFKKALSNVLDVDSYKDILELKIMDVEVDGNEVTFDIKVYYFIDGDNEETQRARLDEFTIEIDDLDFDDEFEDAEVNDAYLDDLQVKQIYE